MVLNFWFIYSPYSIVQCLPSLAYGGYIVITIFFQVLVVFIATGLVWCAAWWRKAELAWTVPVLMRVKAKHWVCIVADWLLNLQIFYALEKNWLWHGSQHNLGVHCC